MSVLTNIFGTHSERELKRIYPLVDKIEALRPEMQKLTDEELRGKTVEFKERLEKGETEKETAIRETKEETGLDIKIISDKRYTQSYIVKENVHKDVVFFIAKLENNNEKRQVEEIEEILWIDINEVENILTYDSLKELWKEAKKDFLVL